MKRALLAAAACAVLVIVTFAAQTPQTPGPAPAADPYANNARPGTTQFPLAAPAGEDSPARDVAPPRAINQSPFNAGNWKDGGAFESPAGSKIWNPGKLKMMGGEKGTGGTGFRATA